MSLMAFRGVGGGEKNPSFLFLLLTRTGEVYRICHENERGAHSLYPSNSNSDSNCFLCPVGKTLFQDQEIRNVLISLGYRGLYSSGTGVTRQWQVIKIIADEKPKTLHHYNYNYKYKFIPNEPCPDNVYKTRIDLLLRTGLWKPIWRHNKLSFYFWSCPISKLCFMSEEMVPGLVTGLPSTVGGLVQSTIHRSVRPFLKRHLPKEFVIEEVPIEYLLSVRNYDICGKKITSNYIQKMIHTPGLRMLMARRVLPISMTDCKAPTCQPIVMSKNRSCVLPTLHTVFNTLFPRPMNPKERTRAFRVFSRRLVEAYPEILKDKETRNEILCEVLSTALTTVVGGFCLFKENPKEKSMTMYVLCSNRGVGRSILNFLKDPDLHLDEIIADTVLQDAIGFYSKCGFQKIPHSPNMVWKRRKNPIQPNSN